MYHHVNMALDLEGVSGTEKLVLVVLARFANKEGLAWPRIETIVAKSSLARRTVFKTLSDLRKKGLVRTSEVEGRKHYELTLIAKPSPDQEDGSACDAHPSACHAPQSASDAPQSASGAPPSKGSKEESEEGIEKKVLACILPQAQKLKLVPPLGTQKELDMIHKGGTVAEVLAGVKSKPANPKTILARLELRWKEVVSDTYEVPCIPSFTGKQKGQLKQFVNKVGVQQAEHVLVKTVKQWSLFTDYVRTAKGIKVTPELPDLGFLLLYAGESANFVLTHEKALSPVQSIATTPKKEVEEEFDPEAYVKECCSGH